jgi:hypothetical protein
MKFYPLQILVIVLLSIVFTACDWLDSNSTTATSNDANFVSLRFTAANSADAAVSKAVFTLEKEGNDSIIVNLDSLPFNTAIDSVIPSFSFRSTFSALVFVKDSAGTKIDSVALTGKDTLNFNRVVRIKNIASDEKGIKYYKIKVNVHTVDPELYQWRKAVGQLYTHQGTLQKAVMMNNTIYYFNSTGLTTSLYTSTNGRDWSGRTFVNDLPDNAMLRNMVVFKNKIFLIHNDSLIYSTTDGVNWPKTSLSSYNFSFKNLLYDFKGKLWALVQNKSNADYKFATSEDGILWEKQEDVVNANFPVGGYAAISFLSRTKQPKVLVAGGYNKDGVYLNKVWSSQDGLYFVDFSKENTTYGYRTGAAIINYEDKLLLFGGEDQLGKPQPLLYMQSADEGLSWKNIDTTTMRIREKYTYTSDNKEYTAYINYERRFNQSALVDKDKNVILIGGRDSLPQTFTDVWVGRLNKSVFIRK